MLLIFMGKNQNIRPLNIDLNMNLPNWMWLQRNFIRMLKVSTTVVQRQQQACILVSTTMLAEWSMTRKDSLKKIVTGYQWKWWTCCEHLKILLLEHCSRRHWRKQVNIAVTCPSHIFVSSQHRALHLWLIHENLLVNKYNLAL